jgi:hypothetical protein
LHHTERTIFGYVIQNQVAIIEFKRQDGNGDVADRIFNQDKALPSAARTLQVAFWQAPR